MSSENYVACWAPANERSCPAAYRLPMPARQELTRSLPGCPITFEHAGVHDALDAMTRAGVAHTSKPAMYTSLLATSAKKGQGHKAPVGAVTAAWLKADGSGECSFRLSSSGARMLVDRGHLKNVSLTHGVDATDRCVPLEVTLCNDPARPGATVVAGPVRDELISLYKASASSASTLPAMEPAAAPITPSADAALTPAAAMEQAWEKLDEPSRKLLSGQLRKIMAANKSAAAENEELKAANAALKVSKQADLELLERQLAIMAGQMPAEISALMGVDNLKATMDDFRSDNSSRVIDAALRTVMCASRTMQMQGAPQGGAAEKRQAVAEPAVAAPQPAAVEPVAAAPALEGMSDRDALRAALAMSFD